MKEKRVRSEKGITLIALIITVVIMLILAVVAISAVVGGDGLFSRISDAKVRTLSEQIKEAISIYGLNKELENVEEELEKYPLVRNDENQYITLDTELSLEEKENLPEELKYILLSLSMDPLNTNVPTLDMIDYTKFYKLDTTNLNIPNEWKDNLYLCLDKSALGYKVINIKGVEYNNQIIYVLIPFNEEDTSQYILIGNNTYKLYGDGTLKVLGELNDNSGITEEERAIKEGWNEFNLSEINTEFENKMSLTESGDAKKIYFSCGTVYVIDQNNDLWAWGENMYNKLGLGHSYIVNEPTKIYSNVKNVWAGKVNTYLVTTDNKIFGAGSNSHGALGQGNMNSYNSFVEININGITGEDVEEMYCAVMEMGSVIIKCKSTVGGISFGCGRNAFGQFGLGNTTNQSTFVQLGDEFTTAKANQIIYNGRTTFILKDNGDLYGCGQNVTGSLGIGDFNNRNSLTFIRSNVADVKCDMQNETIIKDIDGKVYIVGANTNNFMEITNISANPNIFLAGGNLVVSDSTVYDVAIYRGAVYSGVNKTNIQNCLNSYSCSIKVLYYDDKIYTLNINASKPGYIANSNLREVMSNVLFLNSGSQIALVTRNGEIYENAFMKNTELSNIKKYVTTSGSRYALTNDGHLYAKGDLHTGLWGDTLPRDNFVHVTSNGTDYIDNIKDIFVSSDSDGMFYITNENELFYAGDIQYFILPNRSGDLSLGGLNNVITAYPKKASSTQLEKIKDRILDIKFAHQVGGIAYSTTLILTNDGELYVMSTNKNTSGTGQVETSDFVKLNIKEGTKVKQIQTYRGLNLALLENGEVYAWGYNTYGIMGNGYEIGGIYSSPQKLNINNINSISLGNGFAIFTTKTGEIYGIGKNEYGQLGTGDTISRNEFVRCPMLEE